MLKDQQTPQQYKEEAYSSNVDLTTLVPLTCKQCIYTYDNNKREIVCDRCGNGYRVRGGDLVETDEGVMFRGKKIILNG